MPLTVPKRTTGNVLDGRAWDCVENQFMISIALILVDTAEMVGTHIDKFYLFEELS